MTRRAALRAPADGGLQARECEIKLSHSTYTKIIQCIKFVVNVRKKMIPNTTDLVITYLLSLHLNYT